MRKLPSAGPTADAGAADPALTSALAGYDAAPDRGHHPTLAVLQHARLLVPVVATLGEVEYDEQGLAHDKTSDMATVLMRGRDGRLALLAFTGTDSLKAWNADARPVPTSTARAAAAALQDHAEALLIDVGGPVRFVVEGADLRALADGQVLRELDGAHGWFKEPGDADPTNNR